MGKGSKCCTYDVCEIAFQLERSFVNEQMPKNERASRSPSMTLSIQTKTQAPIIARSIDNNRLFRCSITKRCRL
jgi:hypothetical protein